MISPNSLLAFATFVIAIVTVLIEMCIRKEIFSYFLGRKILHIIAVSICAYVIGAYEHTVLLGYLFLMFSILLWLIIMSGKLIVQNDKSLGIALFPFAFGTMLISGWFDPTVVSIAAWILALADPMAGIVGRYSRAKTMQIISESKSIVGTSAFMLTSVIVLVTLTDFTFLTIVVLSILIALSELFSWRGSDNLSIPWVAGLLLLMVNDGLSESIEFILLDGGCLLLLASFAYWRKWLDFGGALAAWFFGMMIILTFGHTALYAPAFFLIFGSLIPRFFGKKGKSSPRNSIQVWANGLMAMACLFIYYLSQDAMYIIFFLAAIGIGVCDTMSSEIGTIIKGKTVDIISWKSLPSGISGGISWQGTFAGVIALIIYIVGCHFIMKVSSNLYIVFIIGLIGMLVDSVLGSRFQALYKHHDSLSEEHNTEAALIKGFTSIDNNVVNLLSQVLTIGIMILLHEVRIVLM